MLCAAISSGGEAIDLDPSPSCAPSAYIHGPRTPTPSPPPSKPTSPSPPTCQSICSFLLLSSPPPLHPIRFTRFLLFLACVPLLPSISSNLQRKRERWSCSCERHTGQQHHFRTHYAVAEPREKPAKHVIQSLSEIQTHSKKSQKKKPLRPLPKSIGVAKREGVS